NFGLRKHGISIKEWCCEKSFSYRSFSRYIFSGWHKKTRPLERGLALLQVRLILLRYIRKGLSRARRCESGLLPYPARATTCTAQGLHVLFLSSCAARTWCGVPRFPAPAPERSRDQPGSSAKRC